MPRSSGVLLLLIGLGGCGPSQREIARINATARLFEPGPTVAASPGASLRPADGPADRFLPAGTRIVTLLDRSITVESNALGGAVSSSVAFEVRDAGGRVVIPGGARVDLVIIRPQVARGPGQPPVDLKVAAVTLRGQRTGLAARIVSLARAIDSRTVAVAANPDRRILVPGGTTIVVELTAALSLPAD